MLEEVVSSCKYVMDNAKYVQIDYNKLDSFIEKIDCSELKYWLCNNPYNLFDLNIETIINFMLILEAIDYSFWGEPKWMMNTDLGFKDGTDALLYSLLNYVRETGNVDFSKLSYDEFSELLKGNVEIPFLKERYETVVGISKIVNEKMNGNFYLYIKDITKDIDLFNVIVNNFESFKDERSYEGRIIYHYKLAQLLVSDIFHIREEIEGIKVSYDMLAGCPDYKIPQTMRALGFIVYNQELSGLVDGRIEIKENSMYEVEIRSSMIVVIDYIKSKLDNVKAIDINDFFFSYSKKVKDIVKPYHMCRTTSY